MTTRSARRSAVVEVRPDAIGASMAAASPSFSRAAGSRRGERETAAACTLELNSFEQAMLVDALSPLTEREREVVFAVCAGGQNPAIAERLYIALPTLRTHLMRINQKLGLRSKSETIRFVLATLLERYRQQTAENANGQRHAARLGNGTLGEARVGPGHGDPQ